MAKSQQFIESLKRVLERQPEAGAGRLLLCCVSGGADSMALFYGLLRLAPSLGYRLAVLHVHHGVRGEDADQDEAFVRDLCQKEGAPFYLKNLPFQKGEKVSEEKLRIGRLKAICDCVREIGASAAFLAHHRDDLAETFLLRLFQGSGLRGLAAFGEQSQFEGAPLIRPLKNVPRDLILRFLKENHISWREDHTNRDTRFLRNRIRHEIIPYLEKNVNPQMKCALARSADHFTRLYAYIRKECAGLLEQYVETHHDPEIPPGQWASLHRLSPLPDLLLTEFFRLWLMRLLNAGKPPRFHSPETLLHLVREGESGSLVRLAGEIAAFKDTDWLTLSQTPLPRQASKGDLLSKLTPLFLFVQNRSFHFPFFKNKDVRIQISGKDVPRGKGKKVLKHDSLSFHLKRMERPVIRKKGHLVFPLKDVKFPLLIRTREPGDEIIAGGQKKSLKKWFGENRIPAPLRDHLAIVQDARGAILSIGDRVLNPVRAKQGPYLAIKWEFPFGKDS
jgi:tRNA(Ile)-lysidine synthase